MLLFFTIVTILSLKIRQNASDLIKIKNFYRNSHDNENATNICKHICAYVKTAYASQDKLAKIRTVATIVCVTPPTLCFISWTHSQQDFTEVNSRNAGWEVMRGDIQLKIFSMCIIITQRTCFCYHLFHEAG